MKSGHEVYDIDSVSDVHTNDGVGCKDRIMCSNRLSNGDSNGDSNRDSTRDRNKDRKIGLPDGVFVNQRDRPSERFEERQVAVECLHTSSYCPSSSDSTVSADANLNANANVNFKTNYCASSPLCLMQEVDGKVARFEFST